MQPSLIATEQRVLQQYLQDLICQANTTEEVDILVEVIMSLQYTNLVQPATWVGLSNFGTVIHDEREHIPLPED